MPPSAAKPTMRTLPGDQSQERLYSRRMTPRKASEAAPSTSGLIGLSWPDSTPPDQRLPASKIQLGRICG